MVSRDEPAVRAHRARVLAVRYPHSAQALEFYARLCEFSGDGDALRELVMVHGPRILRDAAEERTEPALTFFFRALQRRNPAPCDGHAPLAGVLRPEGNGTAFHLLCDVCLFEWRHPRSECPYCGKKELAYFSSEAYAHIRTQVCEGCRHYLHVIDLARDPEAVPDVDEIAALPLDMWAIERGYEKIHPNLIGI